eukprot:CAMPEP_0194310286 /NCGR_PEP_ID=MMETSP0171-20130528/7224_1 /TAXON_ID=218684 /ORGANISM="Corethron pennatum, Strain L29A3" /LENGTH=148 /DNA_ID=CAMNT_0039063831 /DNA_START=60 /DNA_END=506 /DNA_ORIENTATION=-
MKSIIAVVAAAPAVLISSVEGLALYSTPLGSGKDAAVGRRAALRTAGTTAASFAGFLVAGGRRSSIVPASYALDFDAFASSQIAEDTKNCNPKLDPKCIPKLTSDEAMCKYGQSGSARGEACERVKASGKALPDKEKQGKSLGGAYAM